MIKNTRIRRCVYGTFITEQFVLDLEPYIWITFLEEVILSPTTCMKHFYFLCKSLLIHYCVDIIEL